MDAPAPTITSRLPFLFLHMVYISTSRLAISHLTSNVTESAYRAASNACDLRFMYVDLQSRDRRLAFGAADLRLAFGAAADPPTRPLHPAPPSPHISL